MNKVLVLGSNGQLGYALMKSFRKKARCTVSGLDLPYFDITEKDMVFSAVSSEKPDFVVNASAYTSVDLAESEVKRAFDINREGPSFLASVCFDLEIPLVHISTDYVFDGKKKNPYKESDITSPLCVYGLSKNEGEVEVKKNCSRHLIIRTSWLYGVHGRNFVKTITDLAESKEELRVVCDQRGTPTSAEDLADDIVRIIEMADRCSDKDIWGTYHYSGKGETTWYEFACEIIERVCKIKPLAVKKIVPVASSDYQMPARRPAYSVLDCSLIESTFGIRMKDWKESLGVMLKSWIGGGKI